ncbi:MAG: hypothetical protein K8S87_10890 [Planctomycetes bacterium]|nr:hypothetical protein [Planctomycetota bacterium]
MKSSHILVVLLILSAFICSDTIARSKSKKLRKRKIYDDKVELYWEPKLEDFYSISWKREKMYPDLGVEPKFPESKYYKHFFERNGIVASFNGESMDYKGLEYECDSLSDFIRKSVFYLPDDKINFGETYNFKGTCDIDYYSDLKVDVAGVITVSKGESACKYILKGKYTCTDKSGDIKAETKYDKQKVLVLKEGLYESQAEYNIATNCITKAEVSYRYWFGKLEGKNSNNKYNEEARWQFETMKLAGPVSIASKTRLQPLIDRAIAKCVKYLKDAQKRDGGWGSQPTSRSKVGITALTLLALMRSGEKKDSECIEKGFEYLYGKSFATNYEASAVIMACEARGISDAEWKLARENKVAEKPKRDLSADDNRLLESALRYILSHRAKEKYNKDMPYPLWSYGDDDDPKRFDVSVTQYVMYAFYSAMRCGKTIPTKLLTEIVDGFLACQEKKGPSVKLEITDDITKDKKKTTTVRGAKARGWGYIMPKYPYGSMTSAGITTLVIAKACLQNNKALTKKLRTKIDKSIVDGLAFMQHNFSVFKNPN